MGGERGAGKRRKVDRARSPRNTLKVEKELRQRKKGRQTRKATKSRRNVS